MEKLNFEDIEISTETIIAKTNWKVDIVQLYDHLPITFYKIIQKKRGRKSKDEKKEISEKLFDGQIISLKMGNLIKGVNLKEKKNTKKFFRNSLTIVMYLDDKFINFKVSKNGKFQFTGCKSTEQSINCMKFIYDYTKNTKKIIELKDKYTEIIFITVMTNINFNIAFCVNREDLDYHINTETDYKSLLETSFSYTGVNIKIPLNNIDIIPIKKIIYKDNVWLDEFFNYSMYLQSLDEKERKKEKTKNRFNTFLVFQSGNVILSSPHKDCMKDVFHIFLNIIKDCEHKIKELIY